MQDTGSGMGLLWSWMRVTWPRLAVAALLGTLTIASSVALTAVSAGLICHAALRVPLAELQLAIVGVRFFGLSRAGLRYLERLVSHSATFALLAKMRTGCYRALEAMRPAQLRSLGRGDVLSRVVSDVETLEHFYLRVVAPPVIALAITLLTSALLAGWSPALGLRSLAVLGVGLVLAPLLTWCLSRGAGAAEVQARASLKAAWVDTLQGAGDLLLLGAQERMRARTGQELKRVQAAQSRIASAEGAGNAVGVLVGGLIPLVLLPVALDLVRRGDLGVADLVMMVLVPIAALEALAGLPLAVQSLGHSLAAAHRLQALGPGAGGAAAERTLTHAEGAPGPFAIEAYELRFRYGADQPWVLEGTSFAVRTGTFAVLTGESGAGKSTLLHLLAEAQAGHEGELQLAGQDVRDLDEETRRRKVALVTQSTHLFNATLRDNLRLARPGATDAELHRAADAACLTGWIASLPDGLDSWMGEEGLRLSGGERQRVALARALLQDTPLLLLDEPTAELDTETEQHVLAHLKALCPQRTVLMVTHRPAALACADVTFRMELGGGVRMDCLPVESHRPLEDPPGRHEGATPRQSPRTFYS